MRIKRKSFVFIHMRLFHFKEKPTNPLRYGDKTIKKHMFQLKNLSIRILLLKWELLKHIWKQKKMGKTYTRSGTLG